ncbi:MAG: hypothetical protein KC910_33505 [Candidatus Eremiobacteraeota bacterium]|nr:hypothetical protein [Candidatus Eremiobacteraeota bacterium]
MALVVEHSGHFRCSLCCHTYGRVVAGARGMVCPDCAHSAAQMLGPPTLLKPGNPADVLCAALDLPSLFAPARKLGRALARPALLPGFERARHHVLIAGGCGSGKTSLATALRQLTPTAVVDVTSLTATGHRGSPLELLTYALLREGERSTVATSGVVVLDN